MEAIGFNVTAHRVAAYAFAGLIAAVGGILLVWYNGRISPGTDRRRRAPINVLIMAVLGGLRHPIGPFIGALVVRAAFRPSPWTCVDRERFKLVIGTVSCWSSCSRPMAARAGGRDDRRRPAAGSSRGAERA